jgi:RHS repeat-associated protein
MTSQLTLPANPTSQDIFRARIFEEPLVPGGAEPTAEENAAFAAALVAYSARPDLDDFSSLTAFLETHPGSVWNIALLTNLGLVWYGRGYYSRALEAWTKACTLARPVTDPAHKPLADRAIGELASMLARLGRMTALSELLKSVEDRTFCGPATEKIAGARGGLANMRAYQERSFRCGPLALHRIMLAAHPDDPKTELVDASESTQRGCSLHQVAELSQRLGLDYQMAFRHRGAEFVMPAVVHFTVDHFAAVVRREDDHYLLEDPTFATDAWVTSRALEAEASGYFLVPPGQLPEGWRIVEPAEAEEVWGRGNVPFGPDPPGDCDLTTDPCNPCPPGMAVARVHLLNASLNISDKPVGYFPPVGPDMRFMVRYNQRDDQRTSNFNYSNLGRQWTFDWVSFILDSPSNPLAPVKYYMMGGGNRTFTGFDQATQSYAVQPLDQTKLIRTSPSSYTMISADGTRKVFGQSDGGTDAQRCFLTEFIDPAGNSVKLIYDSEMRIVAITDAIGQKTTLEYGNPTDSFKITRVTDPFGRSALFTYNSSSQLISITDVIGLVSKFDYVSSTTDFITTLTTPYGITQFTTGENGTTRSMEILYPDGERERVEFNQTEGLGVPQSDPPTSVPGGMATRNEFLSFRNTYHWDRQGCAYAYGDYTKARIYHWLHSTDLRSPVGILESTKEPLEGRVWYDYGGQISVQGPIVVGTTSKPTHIGRVLDDGTTQLWTYEYNDFGNITKTIDPVGRTFSYTYAEDGIDLLETRQTRAGQSALIFQATYDTRHLLQTSKNAAGQTTKYTYNNEGGQLLTETDPRGNTTTYHYNAKGYRTAVDGKLGIGDTTTYTYDSFGRVRTMTDVSGHTITLDYDALDRVTKTTYPDATFSQSTYTLLDLTRTRDRAGRQTAFEYNSIRQLTKRTDPLDRVALFQWCKCGALRRLTDPMGRTTTWRHDVQGRVKCKEYADGSQIIYLYEANTSRLRQRIDEAFQVTQYTYNRDDTLSGKNYTNASVATPAVSFAYDSSYKRVSSMTDGIGTTHYGYGPITPVPTPAAGEITTIEGPLPNDTIMYGYDELGRCVSTTIDGSVSTVTFDAAGRITNATNALGTFRYTYDGSSFRETSQDGPNGLMVERVYGGDLQDQSLQRITHRHGVTPISEFIYDHEVPTGQINTWSQQFGSANPSIYRLRYDHVNQLVAGAVSAEARTVSTFDYTYDLAGNRLSEQVGANADRFFYNALNELTSSDSPAGNPATSEWDAEQRLTTLTSGNRRTEFTYDGRGRLARIRQLVADSEVSERWFVWSDNDIAVERTPNGNVSKRFYVQGMRMETGAALGSYFYARDHLGSIRELTDDNGNVRARYSYDLFGRRTRLSGDLETDFGFAGMFWSMEASLNITRFRAYDPRIGRWLSRDPLRDAELDQGPNLYTYAKNNPVNLVDPMGLICCPWELAQAVAASAIAAAACYEAIGKAGENWLANIRCAATTVLAVAAWNIWNRCEEKCKPPYPPPPPPGPPDRCLGPFRGDRIPPECHVEPRC